jgi:FAD/FMN-containing dehydrogenase
VVRATEKENADVLWGLRGGGGNFGVVTSFELALHPVKELIGGIVIHPREHAPELLRFWRDYVTTTPDELTTVAALISAPDGVPICAIAACYAGDPAEGKRVLEPLRAFGPPIADQIAPMPYTVVQTMLDQAAPAGMRNYWKADFLNALTDEAIEHLVAAANAAESPLSQVHIHQLGGAMGRVSPDASAFANRGAAFVYNLIGMWAEPSEDDAHITWTRRAFESLRPTSAGSAYINFLGDDGHERIAAAYGPNYERLAELKAKLDPDNIFRLNQNIVPAAG